MKKENPGRERARRYAKAIAEMSDAQRAELASRAPIVTADGRALSGKNMMLAAMQCPAAVMVAGFRQWLAIGRAVRKGESALYIWAPSGGRRAASGAGLGAPSEGDDAAGESVRFLLIPVFDISQTDAESLGAEQAAAA